MNFCWTKPTAYTTGIYVSIPNCTNDKFEPILNKIEKSFNHLLASLQSGFNLTGQMLIATKHTICAAVAWKQFIFWTTSRSFDQKIELIRFGLWKHDDIVNTMWIKRSRLIIKYLRFKLICQWRKHMNACLITII